MGSVLISVEELEKASNAFVDDFGKMDDKIHRFPAGLRDVGERYIVPMVVAIGPYHRASDRLQNMQEVKRAAAYHLIKGKSLLEQVQEAVRSVAGEARKLYAGDAVVGMEDHDFAEMMFIDACFLLQYMDAYSSGFSSNKDFGEDEELLRRFLFTNRACIDNDIMLLENQLPWLVVETIINSLKHTKDCINVVKEFIADMGNTFSIDKDVKDTPPVRNNSNNSPPHLLGLLRCHKITEPGTDLEWPEIRWISASSASELAEIGIKLKASEPPALFTDMDLRERGPLCGELSLAPLSLNETRACWLVNMAAFEVSTASTYQDDPNTTAVCSYLALLSMFMLREEDVRELHSKRILHGHQTNGEMLAFFNKVTKLLPDTGCRFANVMARIEDYKKNRWLRTKVHQFVYNNLGTIITVVTIIGTLVGIFKALLSLNQLQ